MLKLVAVIGSEKDIREPIRDDLERAGPRVSTSAGGEQGLRRLIAPRPDSAIEIGDLPVPGVGYRLAIPRGARP